MDIIKRRRLLNVALGIHVAVAVSAFMLPSDAMPIDMYLNIAFTLIGLAAVLAFVGTYKILKARPVYIFSVGSIFPLIGVLLILLLRERLDAKTKLDEEQ